MYKIILISMCLLRSKQIYKILEILQIFPFTPDLHHFTFDLAIEVAIEPIFDEN